MHLFKKIMLFVKFIMQFFKLNMLSTMPFFPHIMLHVSKNSNSLIKVTSWMWPYIFCIIHVNFCDIWQVNFYIPCIIATLVLCFEFLINISLSLYLKHPLSQLKLKCNPNIFNPKLIVGVLAAASRFHGTRISMKMPPWLY